MTQKIISAGLIRTITERNCLLKTDDLHDAPAGAIFDATYAYDRGHTGYEQHLRPGTPIAQITSSGLWVPTKRSKANGRGAASTSLVVDNAAFFKAGDTISIGGNRRGVVGLVKDNDNAASTGVAIYVHIDELGEGDDAHLESVTAGNADFYWAIGNGGPVVRVEDDDAAATGGVQLYFDEDATDPDSRFFAAVPSLKDTFVYTSDGRAIRIKYHATPSSVGVAVYGDDDAANNYERMLFVSPTNADGVFRTDDEVGNTSYVAAVTGLTISSVSSNTITLGGAASWEDDDAVFGSGALAGSEWTRRILHDWCDLWDEVTHAYVDGVSPSTAIAGTFIKSAMLGDIDAIIAADKVSNGGPDYLSRIKFDTDTGNAA